ncbi:MAG TPA: helix-turn-helix domain-containing protein [Thermoleophilaceae bacterium]|nr:helix-turn-helix domain-containing protein [Thermoleophilaceae bacterium]
MPAAPKSEPTAPASPVLDAFAEVSEAVESGAGLPAVARAAAQAMEASVIVLDARSSILAVACQSPEDERAVLAAEGSTEVAPLRVADEDVGELRLRPRGVPPAPVLLRMVTTLIAQEVDRAQAPERASEAAVADFLSDLLSRKLTDRHNVIARAEELGCDLTAGASVVVARARPHQAEEGDWRERVLAVVARGARAVDRSCLTAAIELGPPRLRPEGRPLPPAREMTVLVPGDGSEPGARAADAVHRELELGLTHYGVVVGVSRPASDPADLHRAGAEALLAANVAEARGVERLAFEETGAYRLLLPAMSEDPGELQRFHQETVAPLIEYDNQYETDLVLTLESFLEADGNVAKTAEKLFTHRHTVRYRLDRVRELSGLDVSSTDGRERLSLGLKSMRVLGIVPPGGPASEAGTGAGRVPRAEQDR